MKTDTETLVAAMRVLARDIQSEDRVANSAIAEAADRLERLEKLYDYLEQPGVLMSIPQPVRMMISRLLHEE